MNDLLLNTKLTPPLISRKTVARQQLLRRLEHDLHQPDGFNRKLTLVCAPAGYGKTSLTVSWLSSLGVPFAWLSLDEDDNDPKRFMMYLLAALQQVEPGLGTRVQAMLALPQPAPIESVLTALINELSSLSGPLIMVVDDYHAIQSDAIHQQIAFLLERQPDYLHQVILSREEPLLPLHRLRARRQLLEIRQEDLRFSVSEVVEYFDRVMGIQLDQADVEAMTRRTEGWIVGLQLAALSMQQNQDTHAFVRSFTGSNRYVLDYLFEEVFKQQTPDVQSFLLRTSILERLTGSLCDALTGNQDGFSQLEALERANLFITPLDAERCWYRYHQLFADLLRHQMRLKGEPGEKSLHRRASLWYSENGYPSEAVQHSLAAEDWESAAELIQAASEGLLKRGEVATLLNWCTSLPAKMIQANPSLSMNYAWGLMLSSQFEMAASILKRTEQAVQGNPQVLGDVAAAQAFLAQSNGDMQRMVEYSHKALSMLSPSSLNSRGLVSLNLGIAYWHIGRMSEAQRALEEALPACRETGNQYGELMARIFLGRILAVRGKLRQAAVWFREVATEMGEAPIIPLAHLDLGTIYYEWNDLESADRQLAIALECSQRSGNLEFQIAAYLLQARLRFAQGKPNQARATLEQALALERSSAIPMRTQARSTAFRVQSAIWLDDMETARQLGEELTQEIDEHPFYRFLGLAAARLLLAEGQRGEAARPLANAAQMARNNEWVYGLIATLVLQAIAADTSEAALNHLGEALRLAQPEGYLRTFIEAGEALAPLLREAARRGMAPALVGDVLSAFPDMQRAASKYDMVETLSERELEVLRLVTAGLSNREIAGALVISTGTAKTHIHNICGKLGVRNRTEAATRAMELNIV